MKICNTKSFVVTSVFCLASIGVSAQDGPESSSGQDETNVAKALEEVIVTGTSRPKSNLDTAFSASILDENALSRYTMNSQADILRTIPSVKAEGGGGEVANNVFIRGLPAAGQFQFTPLQYDGIPVFSTFGMDTSGPSYDVFFRNDLGIEKLEFVRGGASNLFGAGSVAGIINYTTNTGTDTPEASAQIEVAEDNRLRMDFAASGPVSNSDDNNTYYALSGFYRFDEGPIKTGLDTEGVQLRGSIKREFEDGSGSFRLSAQYIDDVSQFFLPLPLDGESRDFAVGNDGNKVRTLQTGSAQGLNYIVPGGRFETRIEDAIKVKGESVMFHFDKRLEDGWGVNARVKYSDYAREFNLFLDGDGVVNTPESMSGFLEARGLSDTGEASFTFSESGQPLGPNDQVFANRLLDRDLPTTDFTAELNLTKELTTGSLDHLFTLGSYFARAETDEEFVISTFLGEFNNRPKLVDLTITNQDGDETNISKNGLLNPGVAFINNNHIATHYAGYFADQIEAGRLTVDVGFRVEKFEGDLVREGSESFLVDDDPSLSEDLQNVVWGNGSFTRGSVEETAWAGAFGLSYRLTDNMSIFGNYSKGFFFPQLQGVQFDGFGEPGDYDAEDIDTSEIGLKYSSSKYSATITGFWTELSNRANVDIVNDPDTGAAILQTSNQSTQTLGIELSTKVFITKNLTFDANATFQDHEFEQFDIAPGLVGNELPRQPNVLANTGLFYDDGSLSASLFHTFTGDNFADEGNGVELDSFNILNLDVGYRFNSGAFDGARVGVKVFNLTESDGITEGSPRQGVNQSSAGEFFVGRQILPRRVSLSLRYDF